MTESKVVSLRLKDAIDDPLTDILRCGAKRLVQQAVEAEFAAFLAAHAELELPDGRQRVVRHGHDPVRPIQTGIGPVEVAKPKARDRGAATADERIRYASLILPKWARRTKSLDVLLPALYLRGVSTGDFQEVLTALLGKDAPNLSPAVIARLKSKWEDEYRRWQERDLSARRYVYVWADGVYLQARMEPQAECMLVLIGATPEGKKELLGFQTGMRESAQSWKELLVDLKARGLSIAPEVAVGDGALGFWKALEEHSARVAPRDLMKVGIFHFQCHGAPSNARPLAITPDLFDDRPERVVRRLESEEIVGKSVFGANRFSDSVGADRSVVDATRNPEIIWPRFPEVLLKEGKRLRSEVESCFDPEPVHFLRRRRPDAMEFPDLQGLDKGRSHLRRDDEQAVRLPVIGREFCQEFVVGDPGGRRKARFGADFRPDFLGDLCRRRDPFQIFCHVEIGLVQRQRLDDRRVFGEDRPDLARDGFVGVETRLHEDEVGAFPLGGDGRHRGAHAELARLVTCRRDDAALARSANGHRLAAQFRIVALLDGGIEGVHVDVDDFARPCRFGRDVLAPHFDVSPSPAWIVVWREHDRQAARPPSSFFPPLATIVRASSVPCRAALLRSRWISGRLQ